MGLVPRVLNVVVSLVVAAGVLLLFARGYGAAVPPLGPAFNPGTGVWTMAADARLPSNETLHLSGLQHPASVAFEVNGTAHVRAATDHDLWLVNGYVEARFRLLEMDLLRRQGEGGLSEIVGSAALGTDKQELRLGLLRTAQAQWARIPAADPARHQLLAYARGVNDRIEEDKNAHTLPAVFKLLGYSPRAWAPVDSLVIQGVETQDLDFSDNPLDYALFVRTLGYQRTMRWFPVVPPNAQRPYASGPYGHHPPRPLPSQLSIDAPLAQAIGDLGHRLEALPYGLLHLGANSNNWVVGGARTASGKPLLAGDPHLHQTLPSIWYQWSGDAPGYHFAGVSIPGTPGIDIGHNRHIAWSLTNVQNQVTFFYVEKTDAAHPYQYFWKGAWRRMRRLSYEIPVKGSGTTRLEVDLTVHGSINTGYRRMPGRVIAIDWIGALPSPDVSVLIRLLRVSGAAQLRAALRDWHAPSQNFAYADDAGHIGIVGAGYYPVVRSGAPWLPLPGTGEADIIGTITYRDIPQVQDPPSHIAASANQRPVGPQYPHYIGTSLNFFDSGYRADRIYAVLSKAHRITKSDIERLQNDIHDYLAGLIVPKLLPVLASATLTARERQARAALRGWNGEMGVASTAASIWWVFWSRYLYDTFNPWWLRYHVPAKQFSGLRITPDLTSLNEDLEHWTLHDPGNTAFSPPGRQRHARDVMLQAFRETVRSLRDVLGPDVRSWQWGRLHTRHFESLVQIASLDYGPRSSSGDQWTVNAANSGYEGTGGPSWRFIMDWGSRQGEGVYSGGQSENPMSAWYQNQIPTWWAGHYYPLLNFEEAMGKKGTVVWRFQS